MNALPATVDEGFLCRSTAPAHWLVAVDTQGSQSLHEPLQTECGGQSFSASAPASGTITWRESKCASTVSLDFFILADLLPVL